LTDRLRRLLPAFRIMIENHTDSSGIRDGFAMSSAEKTCSARDDGDAAREIKVCTHDESVSDSGEPALCKSTVFCIHSHFVSIRLTGCFQGVEPPEIDILQFLSDGSEIRVARTEWHG